MSEFVMLVCTSYGFLKLHMLMIYWWEIEYIFS